MEIMKANYDIKNRIKKGTGEVYHTKNINPIHVVEDWIAKLNNSTGSEPKGGTSPDQDMTANSAQLNFSTDTMTGPENQRIQTTAYMDNGGYDMFGSNTAYNEEKEQGSWWDKNGSDVINGIATVSSALLSGMYNKELQHSQNKYNAAEAQKTRDFNLYMSNTAHQREMADLEAAGLNPANTATGGQGAAGESGAQASGANPPYMGYGDMANTALSLAETMKAINENKYISKEKKAQIANTVADTTNKTADTEQKKKETEFTEQKINFAKKEFEILSEEDQIRQMTFQKRFEAAAHSADAKKKMAEITSEWIHTPFGEKMYRQGLNLGQIGQILNPITNAAIGGEANRLEAYKLGAYNN